MSNIASLKPVVNPPSSQEAIVSRLLALFDELPPQLQLTARYIIDHPHEVGVQTMRGLATKIGVHPNSFTRLARRLGYAGYEQMRERFRDFVRAGAGSSSNRAKWLQELARQGGSTRVLASMAQACLANTEQMFQQQSIEQLEKAVDSLLAAKRVYVLGLGLAYSLAYNFWYLARIAFDHFVLIPNHGTLLTDDLLHISQNDCLLGMTFQPYRVETLNAIRHATKRSATTIAITDSIAATAYREADIGLASPTHTPQFFHSNSAVSALIDSLCALLIVKGSEDANKAIEAFEASRWNADVYEET